MADTKKEIESLLEQAEELSEIREDVLMAKVDISSASIVAVVSKFNEGVDELLERTANAEYYDKDLCVTLKSMVTDLVSSISKIKPPTINVAAPTIDLSPLKSIAGDISKGQNTLISLIDKLNSTNDNGELYRLITAMIGKQNIFLEKGFQIADYTKQLDEISKGVNKKPSEWNGKITKRDRSGYIDEFNLKPNNNV